MLIPALEDTIIAVSSAWCAAPLGILRLSGPESFALARSVGAPPPAPEPRGLPTLSEARLHVEPGLEVPATVFWFSRPKSYTGQDLVEVHAVGCLPLLRALSGRLVYTMRAIRSSHVPVSYSPARRLSPAKFLLP